MKKYENYILNVLIDKYERSKSFTGTNVHNQNFTKRILEMYPKYEDEAQFEMFTEINEQVANLEKEGLLLVKRQKRGYKETEVIFSVTLQTDRLEECYQLLGRKPKSDKNDELKVLLEDYKDKTKVLNAFCEDLLYKIASNKKIPYSEDMGKLEQILKVLSEIESIEEETFIRNFSVKVLGDSKAFEKIKNNVVSILYEYGDYADKDTILQDLNIINNPGYVYVKGNATITISGQRIDLNAMGGDLGLSSAILNNVENVEIKTSKVITIENLTTFNSYEDGDSLIIYLGGYHNSIRRRFIKQIYKDNPDKKYLHYGDIDAGGFYILLDLRKKTGIPFVPFNMDTETLKKYKECTKHLTENDKVRLNHLYGSEFDEVISYMIENNCKLEQEAVEY